jgi:predicted nucleotidyltransferase
MVGSPPDFLGLLRTLAAHRVDFIIVGGVCAVLHGVPVTTFDLDLVHSRQPDNLERLIAALNELDAYYRGRGVQRLRPTADLLGSSGHHLFMTRFGPLDILGTIGDGHDYENLIGRSVGFDVDGLRLHLLDLDVLIAVKEETGHDKDLAVLPLLRRTLAEKAVKDEQQAS